jgi:hypothetical protein
VNLPELKKVCRFLPFKELLKNSRTHETYWTIDGKNRIGKTPEPQFEEFVSFFLFEKFPNRTVMIFGTSVVFQYSSNLSSFGCDRQSAQPGLSLLSLGEPYPVIRKSVGCRRW